MAIDWNYLLELGKKWLFVIIVVLVIAIYLIAQNIIENNKKKKRIQEMKKIMTPEPPKDKPTQKVEEIKQQEQERKIINEDRSYNVPILEKHVEVDQPIKIKTEDSFSHLFDENIQKNSTMSFQDVLNELGVESNSVENQMSKDFEQLKLKLEDIHAKKETVKQYGMKLANLYDNYRQREFQLTEMMVGLEKILNRSKKVKQIGSVEELRN